MGPVVPLELAASDGAPEGQEGMERAEMNGVAGRERAGHVGAGALVGEDPEVELRQEAREVREHGGGRRGEGLHPQRGDQVDGVLLEEGVRILDDRVALGRPLAAPAGKRRERGEGPGRRRRRRRPRDGGRDGAGQVFDEMPLRHRPIFPAGR